MKKDNFIQGALIATICLVITKILGIIYVIPFYATVGATGSVIYGCAYNVYAVFINLSTIGLPLAISKLVSEYNTLGYEYLKKKSYKISSRIMLVTAFIATILLFVFAKFIAVNIITDTNSSLINEIVFVIRISATAIMFVTIISMIRGYMQGMKYIRISSISQVIEQIVRVLIIILGSYITLKLTNNVLYAVGVAVSGATFGAIASMVYLIIKKKKINNIEKEMNYTIKDEEKNVKTSSLVKKIIFYTIPFVVMGVFGTSFELVDMFTVVRTLTKHGFSTENASIIMNIVTTLGSKLNVIITAIASGIVISLLPNLTSDFVKNDKKEINKKINKTLQIVIYTTIPMAVGLSLLANPVWNIFYGKSFYGPKVFCFSVFVAVFSSLSTNVMIASQSLNRYKSLYIGLVGGFLFNASTNILFMEIFDKIGLPIYYGNLFATMIGYSITIIVPLIDIKHKFNISYKETIKQFFITIFAVIVMSIVILLLTNIIPIINLGRFKSILIVILYAIVGMIVYFGLTYKISFKKIFGEELLKKFKK